MSRQTAAFLLLCFVQHCGFRRWARHISSSIELGGSCSFSWQSNRIRGGRLRSLSSEHPGLQPIEVDVDDRRRIERQDLRQSETADDGVAERLAKLRADPATQHHRYATKQRRHCG